MSESGDAIAARLAAAYRKLGLSDKPRTHNRATPEQKEAKKVRRRGLVRHHASKRRAAKLQRTAPWADQDAIRALHELAQAMTEATGTPHHVDHVIPLQGELVSGLHVETNMQILTGAENSRKKNHYEPC